MTSDHKSASSHLPTHSFRKVRGGQTSNRRESSMSISGQRSLLRDRTDSSGCELGPSAGASGSATPESRDRGMEEGSELIRCLAIAARHFALAPNGAVPVDQRVVRASSLKIASCLFRFECTF